QLGTRVLTRASSVAMGLLVLAVLGGCSEPDSTSRGKGPTSGLSSTSKATPPALGPQSERISAVSVDGSGLRVTVKGQRKVDSQLGNGGETTDCAVAASTTQPAPAGLPASSTVRYAVDCAGVGRLTRPVLLTVAHLDGFSYQFP